MAFKPWALAGALLLLGAAWAPPRACLAAGDPQPVVGQAGPDIEGPMEPLPLPESQPAKGHPMRRVVAAAVAVGFGLLVGYYVRRRQRRATQGRAGAGQVARLSAAVTLSQDDLSLPDDQLYVRLLGALREALDGEAGGPAAAMTPRELSRMEPEAVMGVDQTSAADLRERLRAFCDRAERAEYARARIAAAQREADLRFVLDFGGKARRARKARGGRPGGAARPSAGQEAAP